jgi:hypothetical protein
MANILPREKQIEVLQHLIDGNTLRSTARLTKVHRTTIQDLLVSFGQKCQAFMDSKLRGLTLKHLECDEIWTFAGKKQGRLTVDEKRERHDIGDIYVWTALDAETKLIPTFIVGKRSADNARKMIWTWRLVSNGPPRTNRMPATSGAPDTKRSLKSARICLRPIPKRLTWLSAPM